MWNFDLIDHSHIAREFLVQFMEESKMNLTSLLLVMLNKCMPRTRIVDWVVAML